jgi:hypothetical protein
MPDRMPEYMAEYMPDRMPVDMPDRTPEDLPVTKRTNVMVGMTRSKVISLFSTKHHHKIVGKWMLIIVNPPKFLLRGIHPTTICAPQDRDAPLWSHWFRLPG